MTMAQLELMPSNVSGEAYVIPYENSKNINGRWEKVMEAQFQLGYQGLVTLFYRAGVRKIVGELVRENDAFEYVNGEITHKVDPFAQRGSRRGAYCIVTLANGEKVSKVMSKDEILEIAENFSKSYGATKKDGSKAKTPWDEDQDPQGWMWIKTVLKQLGKLLPKNEKILQAIAEDNKDSVIADRLPEAMETKEALTMGAILKKTDEHDHAESTTQTPGKEAGNAAEDHGSDE
jgi:recombination protein RecT